MSLGPFDAPFQVVVYDHAFAKRGALPLSSLVATVRHNQQSNATLGVPAFTQVDGRLRPTPRLVDLVTDEGARVDITYLGEPLLSGVRSHYERSGFGADATYAFEIADDWALFERMLAWPTPGSDLAHQTSEQDVRSAAAETVVKGIVTANAAHLTPPVTVADDQHRGAVITVQNRFTPLTDRLVPLLDAAGIGVTVRRSTTAAGLVVDVYEGREFPHPLTEESGILGDLKLTWSQPTATQVIVGGKGDGVARVFTLVVDTALEASLGYAIQAFLDATDTDTAAQRTQRGLQYLAEHGRTASISASLQESPVFHYRPSGAGNAVRPGDRIQITTAQGETFTDVLRSVTLSWTSSDGLKVTPQIGEHSDSDTDVLDAVTASQKALRQQARR